jgi:MtaA/CmuA family methyltransferase
MTRKKAFQDFCNGIFPQERAIFHPVLMHFIARYAGGNYAEFASDHRFLVEANLRALDDFDLDMVGLISDPYRETSAFGARIKFIPEGVPRCLDLVVKTRDDVSKLRRPDVYKSERTLDRIRGAELLAKLTMGDVPIIGWIEGPMAEACDLAGIEQFMMMQMMDPDTAHHLLAKCVLTAKDFARAQMDAGCDIIGMGDAICSQIDPFTYETYVKELHREIIDFIHSLGGKVKLHICGDLSHLLPSLKDLGIDILDIDWQVDPDDAAEVMGPDVILCGNIDPRFVHDKSTEEIFSACKLLVNRAKNRKFILSAGCEIIVTTPVTNLKAMRMASFYK